MPETVRSTVGPFLVIAFTGLLVMLRLEADRFGAAEYAESDRWGRRPRLRSRLAWYLLGLVGVLAIWSANPDPDTSLYLRLGDRADAILGGLAYGTGGVAVALGFAWLRYRHVRLPAVRSYPVALLNSIGTAFIDEAAFRGALLGILVLAGLDTGLAIVVQTLVYGLACRLGAPGRSRPMFVLSLAIGLASGYVTVATGGIGAAFLGHAIARVAAFVATGHAGQPAPVGREVEEIEERRRMPDGWASVGTARRPLAADSLAAHPGMLGSGAPHDALLGHGAPAAPPTLVAEPPSPASPVDASTTTGVRPRVRRPRARPPTA